MKKVLSIILSVLLFLFALIFVFSAVITIIDCLDDYYPITSILPIFFYLGVAVDCVLLALKLLKVQRIKFVHIIVVAVITILLFGSIKPINNVAVNSWERHIKLTYDGTEIEPITKTTKLRYNLQNITNHELKDVVVVFSCKGFDKDGNEVSWDAEYETHRDIPPNNDMDISVMTLSLEIENYSYWESEIKFIAFE